MLFFRPVSRSFTDSQIFLDIFYPVSHLEDIVSVVARGGCAGGLADGEVVGGGAASVGDGGRVLRGARALHPHLDTGHGSTRIEDMIGSIIISYADI